MNGETMTANVTTPGTIKVEYINAFGNGYAQEKEVPVGTTVSGLARLVGLNADPERYFITLDYVPAGPDDVLYAGAQVGFTVKKAEGGVLGLDRLARALGLAQAVPSSLGATEMAHLTTLGKALAERPERLPILLQAADLLLSIGDAPATTPIPAPVVDPRFDPERLRYPAPTPAPSHDGPVIVHAALNGGYAQPYELDEIETIGDFVDAHFPGEDPENLFISVNGKFVVPGLVLARGDKVEVRRRTQSRCR